MKSYMQEEEYNIGYNNCIWMFQPMRTTVSIMESILGQTEREHIIRHFPDTKKNTLDIQELAPWPRGGGINPGTNNPEIANHGNINFAPKLCENPRMPKPTRSVTKNQCFQNTRFSMPELVG